HYYSPSRTMGRKVVESFSRRVLSRTDAVIVPTAKVARLLTGYRVDRPLHVNPTGLTLQRFRSARPAGGRAHARALRAGLGIRPEQRVRLSVSRLANETSRDEVLEMMSVAAREDTARVLVGEGPYRGALEARAGALGITDRVRFTGVVAPADIPRWYRIGDVFVGASLSETQGLTFIEAMSSGLPLLCRRDPSLASVVVEGVTGWQFEGSAQFTTRLNALLDDPREREQMSRAALDRAR